MRKALLIAGEKCFDLHLIAKIKLEGYNLINV